VGFCVVGDRLLRDAHERPPRASTDDRRDSNACKSRPHAGHHEPV
jgi:hypothetical protein